MREGEPAHDDLELAILCRDANQIGLDEDRFSNGVPSVVQHLRSEIDPDDVMS